MERRGEPPKAAGESPHSHNGGVPSPAERSGEAAKWSGRRDSRTLVPAPTSNSAIGWARSSKPMVKTNDYGNLYLSGVGRPPTTQPVSFK